MVSEFACYQFFILLFLRPPDTASTCSWSTLQWRVTENGWREREEEGERGRGEETEGGGREESEREVERQREERGGREERLRERGEERDCLLYTSPSPRDDNRSRMPSSA